MTQDAATLLQIKAADPAASTWLSANAGSGKTRVLTNRVARLLLARVSPQNILCLTYTKAAAGEMQNRLFKTLGAWSMLSDEKLITSLAELGVTEPGDLANARTLFARAIETPGGLRIQTIHSFCAGLLRRFPLEAGVSPGFSDIEERAAKLLQMEIIEEIADGPQVGILTAVAQHYTGEDFAKLAGQIVSNRHAFGDFADGETIWKSHGLVPGFAQSDLHAAIFTGNEADLVADLIGVLRKSDKSTDNKAAERLVTHNFENPGAAEIKTLISLMLFGETAKAPFAAKFANFPTKAVRAAHPDLMAQLDEFMARVETGRETRNSLYSAEKSLALHNFASVFLAEYQRRKDQRGWLDFDDLISRAGALLTDPAVAQWVLFRLDGGIDHILVDEAQDTSPQQWKIIELLTQEFSAGQGARDNTSRTVFVVGDTKQSIYSFQGADPREFENMRQHFTNSLSSVGQTLHEQALQHSFRSSSAILELVDATFADTSGAYFGSAIHQAYFSGMAGRVDLWPVVEKPDAPEEKNWYDSSDLRTPIDHRVILARAIAEQMKHLVETESIQGEDGHFRQVRYGDFLILVQRRSDLFTEIIRACKVLDLPIAGADRLKIGGELAVKDLTALMSFLVTPDDDLSLAAALRSPLFGLTEAQLYDLAHSRHEPRLWPALVRRKNDFAEIHETLSSLRNQAEFLSPFELLERILTRFDGRRKLLARLGHEAEEGIDAILGQALGYERSETPSLTGFLTWLEIEEVEVKRQADSAGNRIRVMTTHGAKGLESPIVILPDTADTKARPPDEIVLPKDAPAVWIPSKDFRTSAVRDILAQAQQKQIEERERLLYVALTRAEKWLIVCACGTIGAKGNSWYNRVSEGMSAVEAVAFDHPTGTGFRLEHGDWTPAGPDKKPSFSAPTILPNWAVTAATIPARLSQTISPSTLGGAKVLPADYSDGDEEAAMRRGSMLHLLLEHLPNSPRSEWAALAKALIGTETPDILAEATQVLSNPDLAAVFAPDALAEVDISANLPTLGDQRMRGIIDRLVILPDRVLIVDFKSNQLVPDTPQLVPAGLLAQMGAYLEAIEQIYPSHQIDTAILWTRTASLMALPHDIVRSALATSTTS
ncbi:MAG: double-strand break repair helicase AddA [Marinosulfonomonas sp.]|nr:double-strand break repair helicase AddA [Marinosulfonomonas sp.]